MRTGIFTAIERWQMISGEEVFVHTETYLQPLYGELPPGKGLWIDATLLPDALLADTILSLDENTALAKGTDFIAGILTTESFSAGNALACFANIQQIQNVHRLQHPWHIFQCNDAVMREDFNLIRSGKISQQLPSSNIYINPGGIFIEEGAQVQYATLNAATGPVYIAKNAAVMEGCFIRGPFTLGVGAVLKMGAKIYGATTIGPYCIAGGEIKNSVIQAYSNKAHDGYLGDSVIGQWCNLGAGTSNSNVKNTGGIVKMWNYCENNFIDAGTKAGMIMGDYSRAAVNTAFNTGTVAGVCCNIFNGGLLPKFIPGFSWGGSSGHKYSREKIISDISNWKKMKGAELTDAEQNVLLHIFDKEW